MLPLSTPGGALILDAVRVANGATYRSENIPVPQQHMTISFELRATAGGPCNLGVKVRSGNNEFATVQVDRAATIPAGYATMTAGVEVASILQLATDTAWVQLEFAPVGADVVVTVYGAAGGVNAVTV